MEQTKIEYRPMKLFDFLKIGNLGENEKNESPYTGNSVFINKDKSIQGILNHYYEKFWLFFYLLFGLSPIRFLVVLALDRGKPVGACWSRGMGKDESLVGIFVNPDYRMMGIGTNLVKHIVPLADEHKVNMTIVYDEGNPAIKIFEKAGFRLDSKWCKMKRRANL